MANAELMILPALRHAILLEAPQAVAAPCSTFYDARPRLERLTGPMHPFFCG